MTADPRIAQAYFDAWRANDYAAMRELLDDEVDFIGPLGQFFSADACIEGIKGMEPVKTDIVIQKIWADGDDLITWFDLHTNVTEPLPVANWSRVKDGKIARIRVAFNSGKLAAAFEK